MHHSPKVIQVHLSAMLEGSSLGCLHGLKEASDATGSWLEVEPDTKISWNWGKY